MNLGLLRDKLVDCVDDVVCFLLPDPIKYNIRVKTKYGTHTVIFLKESESCWGSEVLTLPGCFSAGDEMASAINNTVEAIEGHIELLVELNENES